MFILPSEHLPHTATWMAFGADPAIWSASLAEKVCRDQAALALAIARFEPVNLLVTRKNKKFGDAAADEHAVQLLASLYPGRTVVQVNIDGIAAGGGGIHCVTMQQPDFTSFTTDGQTHDTD